MGNKQRIVCAKCGGERIEELAWVDVNSKQYKSSGVEEIDDKWCNDCKDNVNFLTRYKYEKTNT